MARLVTDETTIDFNVTGVVGAFHSQAGYAQSETVEAEDRAWKGVPRNGLDATHALTPTAGSLDAYVAWTSSATWGQENAAGFTTGDARRAHRETLSAESIMPTAETGKPLAG